LPLIESRDEHEVKNTGRGALRTLNVDVPPAYTPRVRAPTSVTLPSSSCRITTRLGSQASLCEVSAETRVPSTTDWPGA
jgi:hypothetical protein